LYDDTKPKEPNGSIEFSTLSLTKQGIDFCKNFHEAYQELDKIEI
jgi:hypothetical protein